VTTALPGRPSDAMLLGYSALIEHYQIACPPPRPLVAISAVGRKTSVVRDGATWLLLPRNANFRLPETPIGHLGPALKHEGVDLRILSRLFAQPVEAELGAFIEGNLGGQYTRRAWFLYEWLTGRRLAIKEPYGVGYVPALDPNRYFTLHPARSPRHKVDDNMPGVPGFCPLVRRTERLAPGRTEGLAAEARAIVSAADPAVLRRAVGFLLLNESKGSFSIEGETPPRTRLERWGRLIADAKDIRLSVDALESLHRSLFDERHSFAAYGLRTAGGFVGRHDSRDQSPIPDHVSARPEDLQALLSDLLAAFAKWKARKFDPVLTAALLGFGFVFIHPFEDGNGRLHRFLFQKALVDTGFNPRGVVLPVSAAILEDMPGYRTALEDYSVPTLPFIDWEPADQGNVRVTNDTAYLYRYFDATRQAEYLADRIERTVRFSLPTELQYLHRFDDAKRRVAALADLPDRLVSLFIQFCAQNGGVLSARKREEYFDAIPIALINQLEDAVRASGIAEPIPGARES
jgi:hypothetical protein